MQALPISGGEQCIGFAINGSEFEKPENNPAITCSFPVEKLDLNYFTGPLPAFIGNMSALTVLSIAHNSFSGPIPKELGNLKELTMLSFGSNNFSGTLPPELGNLVNLGLFYMDSCGLGGEIPSTFAKLINMKILYASDNPFSGKIPSFIGNWRKLTSLDLGFNNLTGELPSSLFNISSLTYLFLGNNSLSGPLPSQKSNQLQSIDLSYNYFSGSFPRWVTTISQLNLVVNNFTFDSSNITLPGLNCLPRNFPCHRSTPRYANFSIKCGGPQMRGNDGILYKAEDSALGPATFNVTSTQKWAVSNAGFSDNLNQSFVETTLTQVSGADLTPELYKTSRVSPGSLRYYDLGLQNGPYTVSLQFAETVFANRDTQTSQSPGRRVFDIDILGYLRRKDFDISKQAGGVNRAVPRPFKVNVTENYLDIHLFWAGKGICCIPEQDLTPTTPGKKSRTGLIVGIAVPVGVGTLSDGWVVAVKQLSVASHQGKSQFVTEIATISAVQHRNLVKLYGCCFEGSHRILVYEYLENKSLDHALFGRNDLHLNWPTRFNILLGTARGLAYLHEESMPRIIHRDVKASNILLDAELSPKISDFGWAKLYDDEKTHMSIRVAGTIGYLTPDYAMRGHLTEKADVFGFKVVALEILSGRPNSDENLDPEKIYLLEWAWTLHEKDQSLGPVDPRLTEFDENDATRLIKAALLCTLASPMMRPSMSRVVAVISVDIEASTVMSKPSYLTDWDFKDVTTSSFLVDDDTSSTESIVVHK
ncbi:unnamed protein product [Prunus armeniaca]